MGKWAADRRLAWEQLETRGLLTTKVSSTVASFSANLVGSKLVVAGPVRPYATRRTCSVFLLDVRLMKWTWKDIAGGPMLCQHSAVLLDDKILSYGGLYPDTFDQVWALDTCLFKFSRKGVRGRSPVPRRLHIAEFIERRKEMVVFGGKTRYHSPLNDLCVLDCEDFTWHFPRVTGQLPKKRFEHASTVVDTTLYVYGGCSRKHVLGDLHVIRCETGFYHWSSPRTYGIKPRKVSGASLSFVDGRILLYGGRSSHAQSRLAILDLAKKRWYADSGEHSGDYIVTGERIANAQHSAVVVHEKVVVLGGTGMDFGQCFVLSDNPEL